MGLDIEFRDAKQDCVASFRKVNFLVSFFENARGYEIENCRSVKISSDDVEELRDRCQQVLDNFLEAPNLLPVSEGFFFGSYEYNQYYLKDVEEVLECCNKILNDKEVLKDLYFWIWY